jgi:hypothetical protein
MAADKLVFREECYGLRVFRLSDDKEVMIARVDTKDPITQPVSPDNPYGATAYVTRSALDCTVHSAIGPLPVAYLQEILTYLAK